MDLAAGSQTTIGTRTTHLSPEKGRQGDGRATAFGGPVSCQVRLYGSQKMSDKIGTITLMKDGPGVEAHF